MTNDLEDMMTLLFARRAVIDSKPDDPDRIDRIIKEWWGIVRLMEQGHYTERHL